MIKPIFRRSFLSPGIRVPKMTVQEQCVITGDEQKPEPASGFLPRKGPHPSERIRLALLDGHSLFRASLASFLASERNMEVTGDCGTCAEALTLIGHTPIDVLVFDIAVEDASGIPFLSAAREQGFGGRFLIVTSKIGARDAARALKLGAAGIFLKSDEPERLINAIRLVARGEIWIDRSVVQLMADQVIDPGAESCDTLTALPDRERKVLLGIVSGLSNRRIGESIRLSESSVKAVVQRLFARAGVRTRSQLVRMALEGSPGASFAAPADISPDPSEITGARVRKSRDNPSIARAMEGFATADADTARAQRERSGRAF